MNLLIGTICCGKCGEAIAVHANGDAACSCEYLDYELRGEEAAEKTFNLSDDDAVRLERRQVAAYYGG